MKILVTGAHFTPAIAVIEELKKYPDTQVVYVGRKKTLEGDNAPSVESQVLPSLGVKFIPIVTGRLQREFTIYTIPSLLKIPIGFIQAFFIILYQKPDVILSFGGYVGVPLVMAGWLLSVPVIIHEQTLISGLASKISALFANKVALSFPNKSSGEKFILTGNPIRREIIEMRKGVNLKHPEGVKLPVILVTGGNQGSHVINLAVEECLQGLTKIARIIHITGDNKFKDYERLKNLENNSYSVRKWVGDSWGEVLSKADLVVSRAGINTLFELAYLGKPVLLVPIPYLYGDEQNKNAKYFEKLGLAKILPQSQLCADTLLRNINIMLQNLPKLKEKAKEAKKVIIPDAGKRLALETVLLAKI